MSNLRNILLACLSLTSLSLAAKEVKNNKTGATNEQKYANFCHTEKTVQIGAEFLWWATNYNFPYSIGITSSTAPDTGADVMDVSVFRTKTKWSPGVRLSLGYSSANDNMDIIGIWTLYNNHSNSSANMSMSGIPIPFLENLTFSEGASKLNLNVADIEVGKNYFTDFKVLVRPFIGIRGAWIDQYQNLFFIGTPDEGTTETNIHLDQDNWCVGPRIGVNTSWFKNHGFSLIANFSGSCLYGKAHQTLHIDNIDSDLDEDIIKAKDHYWELIPNIQMLLGVSYEKCFNHHRSFKVFAGWEPMFWWQTSSVLWIDRSISTQGLTLGASVNF